MHPECAVFLMRGPTVFLGRAPKQKFLSPPIGKIGPLETPQEAAVRVVRQLTNFDFKPEYWQNGVVIRHVLGGAYQVICVFTTADFITMEKPRVIEGFVGDWVLANHIPYDQMAPGDNLWVPFAVMNKAFRIQIDLDADGRVFNHQMLA